jgi:hypothetical protein
LEYLGNFDSHLGNLPKLVPEGNYSRMPLWGKTVLVSHRASCCRCSENVPVRKNNEKYPEERFQWLAIWLLKALIGASLWAGGKHTQQRTQLRGTCRPLTHMHTTQTHTLTEALTQAHASTCTEANTCSRRHTCRSQGCTRYRQSTHTGTHMNTHTPRTHTAPRYAWLNKTIFKNVILCQT